MSKVWGENTLESPKISGNRFLRLFHKAKSQRAPILCHIFFLFGIGGIRRLMISLRHAGSLLALKAVVTKDLALILTEVRCLSSKDVSLMRFPHPLPSALSFSKPLLPNLP